MNPPYRTPEDPTMNEKTDWRGVAKTIASTGWALLCGAALLGAIALVMGGARACSSMPPAPCQESVRLMQIGEWADCNAGGHMETLPLPSGAVHVRCLCDARRAHADGAP